MNKDNSILNSDPRAVLDSLNDGLYVTDRDRLIVYWGQSAERITGWQADNVIGKRCSDNVLCHIDNDGYKDENETTAETFAGGSGAAEIKKV